MSPKAGDLAARARATQTRGKSAPAAQPAPAADDAEQVPQRAVPAASPVRVKPVRITTDVPPQMYRFLSEYSADTAATLGKARVPGSEVVRALLDELQASPHLQDQVRARLGR